MRMTASWSGSSRTRRIQVCGAMVALDGELPSDGHSTAQAVPAIRSQRKGTASRVRLDTTAPIQVQVILCDPSKMARLSRFPAFRVFGLAPLPLDGRAPRRPSSPRRRCRCHRARTGAPRAHLRTSAIRPSPAESRFRTGLSPADRRPPRLTNRHGQGGSDHGPSRKRPTPFGHVWFRGGPAPCARSYGRYRRRARPAGPVSRDGRDPPPRQTEGGIEAREIAAVASAQLGFWGGGEMAWPLGQRGAFRPGERSQASGAECRMTLYFNCLVSMQRFRSGASPVLSIDFRHSAAEPPCSTGSPALWSRQVISASLCSCWPRTCSRPSPPSSSCPWPASAARGTLNMVGVVVAGTAGSLAGALLWYYIGRWIGLERLKRWAAKHGDG